MRDEPALLKIAEAAVVLNVSRSKGYELARTGEIPVVRVGGSLRVPKERLRRWVEDRTRGGETVR